MKPTIRQKLEPEVCTYLDDQMDHMTVEIVLPNVSQNNIKLRVNSRCLILFAVSGDIHYAKYMCFRFPVIAKKAIAAFGNGLLRIEMPLRS
jgi:HSP20 family molecular chaperone IbpA